MALPLALSGALSAATAGECPGNPDALGTSRTLVVDPRDHRRIGTISYRETLPLADREVVLTFDDGPIPPYTPRILDILAAECVQATYFIIGEKAKEYPALVQRVYDAGHSIGTHSMTHPYRFRALSAELGNAQIDDGIAAVAAALGDPDKVAPFFRFPGFGNTEAAQEHLASRGLMVWGADVPADDWLRLSPRDVARRAVQRLEHKGKGILLLHDIHARTVEALPFILAELKGRGFRVVHVVPASADRTPTATAAADWVPAWESSPAARAVPVFLIADVQEADGNLSKKSAEELCLLTAPRETTVRRTAAHKHGRRAAHAANGKSGRSKAKLSHRSKAKPSKHAKSKPAKFADARPTASKVAKVATPTP